MPRPTPTEAQRAALERFEAVYRQWTVASESLAATEARLWTESLRDPAGEHLEALAADVLRLRQAARVAFDEMLPLLRSLE